MSESNSLSLIYTTTASYESARDLSRTLLNERLIACANILRNASSMYIWNGEINTSDECVIIMKTTTDLCPPAMSRIKALHTYYTPALFSIPIENCTPEFLAWVASCTK